MTEKESALTEALKIVCKTLADYRDEKPLPEGWAEDLKYSVVDRAIEHVEPGFDGGTTTVEQLHEGFAYYRSRLEGA